MGVTQPAAWSPAAVAPALARYEEVWTPRWLMMASSKWLFPLLPLPPSYAPESRRRSYVRLPTPLRFTPAVNPTSTFMLLLSFADYLPIASSSEKKGTRD